MPCGKMSRPWPKLATNLPEASNLRIDGKFDIWPVARSRQLLAPQRSATQMLRPSLSISTALVEPHVRPSGILKKCSIVVYGLGAEFVGALVVGAWARTPTYHALMRATTSIAAARFIQPSWTRAGL